MFNVDPLAYARDKEMQNSFYHLVMTPESMEAARYYYPVGSETKATEAEILALGIATGPSTSRAERLSFADWVRRLLRIDPLRDQNP